MKTSAPNIVGSWAEDRDHKYVIGMLVSVDERLAWLEDMLALALASGALPKRRDEWGQVLVEQIP